MTMTDTEIVIQTLTVTQRDGDKIAEKHLQ